MKTKICYVLNEYNENTDTHLAHTYVFLHALQNTSGVDVRIVSLKKGIYAGFFSIKNAQKNGYEIYVHYSFKGALMAWLITRIYGGHVFYWNCGMPWLYKRGLFEEKMFRFILRNTVFVTGTVGMANEYKKHYGLKEEHIRIVPNAINISQFQNDNKRDVREMLSIPQDKKVILFVHHLSRRKGAHMLPEIINHFNGREDVMFIIVGSGPEEEYLRKTLQVVQRTLHVAVRLEGCVPNKIVAQYFTASDIFLMPSEEEGFPHVLLEAMAAGIPFIASNVGGIREIIPPDFVHYTYPPNMPDMFADGLQKLLSDAKEREYISVKEREWIKRYDIFRVLPQFLALFQK
ncbi:MAG: hypothetical protein COU90_01885 [Candidatus Ryanbacteria bacterium CG10_big_fil_rev_8_21_14_0_10_43_42]|uniref:Glycosyl transferase family 1 domain-containing protein n=1 Tax=Candidatus Ryanbacteria bacterium CG10_big_fil_rev_8_21_14_0_10_43_42 TaxID=1974864 RepID=A0A2M8KXB6_9BACT|nr:MAG: hypothetical protein COU90_01885 [Candidatus Ryanbacteria bacterium CG10_big_fil_rev_8_21_14_0_10_43_42]